MVTKVFAGFSIGNLLRHGFVVYKQTGKPGWRPRPCMPSRDSEAIQAEVCTKIAPAFSAYPPSLEGKPKGSIYSVFPIENPAKTFVTIYKKSPIAILESVRHFQCAYWFGLKSYCPVKSPVRRHSGSPRHRHCSE